MSATTQNPNPIERQVSEHFFEVSGLQARLSRLMYGGKKPKENCPDTFDVSLVGFDVASKLGGICQGKVYDDPKTGNTSYFYVDAEGEEHSLQFDVPLDTVRPLVEKLVESGVVLQLGGAVAKEIKQKGSQAGYQWPTVEPIKN